MPSRREFFNEVAGATAGIVFTDCGLRDARQSTKSGGAQKRRQVMVGGRRVRTIDIHAHVVVPEATALMRRKTEADNAAIMGRRNGHRAVRAHGRMGHRHAGSQHQSHLVVGGARRGQPGHQASERKFGRVVRQVSRPVRGVCFSRKVAILGGNAARLLKITT